MGFFWFFGIECVFFEQFIGFFGEFFVKSEGCDDELGAGMLMDADADHAGFEAVAGDVFRCVFEGGDFDVWPQDAL